MKCFCTKCPPTRPPILTIFSLFVPAYYSIHRFPSCKNHGATTRLDAFLPSPPPGNTNRKSLTKMSSPQRPHLVVAAASLLCTGVPRLLLPPQLRRRVPHQQQPRPPLGARRAHRSQECGTWPRSSFHIPRSGKGTFRFRGQFSVKILHNHGTFRFREWEQEHGY